jgi:hypothetical protein
MLFWTSCSMRLLTNRVLPELSHAPVDWIRDLPFLIPHYCMAESGFGQMPVAVDKCCRARPRKRRLRRSAARSWMWASAGVWVPGLFPLLLRVCRGKDCIVNWSRRIRDHVFFQGYIKCTMYILNLIYLF